MNYIVYLFFKFWQGRRLEGQTTKHLQYLQVKPCTVSVNPTVYKMFILVDIFWGTFAKYKHWFVYVCLQYYALLTTDLLKNEEIRSLSNSRIPQDRKLTFLMFISKPEPFYAVCSVLQLLY